VYTGLVHGATGIIYFAMDSYATRAGSVVGMSPRSLSNGTYADASPTDSHTRASPSLLDMTANLWDSVAALNTELSSLENVLFAPTSQSGYTVAFSGNNATETPVRTVRKSGIAGVAGDVIIAVNVDSTRLTMRIDLLSTDTTTIEVMFEERQIQVNGSAFVDRFEPMDVHVYRLVHSG
jgi:hypothetical protein